MWNFLAKIIQVLLGVVSPELKKYMGEGINALYKKAKGTDNPVDDVLVEALATLLGVTLER